MKRFKKIICMFSIIFLACGMITPLVYAEGSLKVAFVDLRRAFYEYEKSKAFDKDLTAVTTERTDERNKMVEDIRKLRDEAELLGDDAKAGKQKQIDAKITELNNFDRDTRQELLNKKNDMFREVVEDIQAVVDTIGQAKGLDYILDSRNVMYAKEGNDLTDEVISDLNK